MKVFGYESLENVDLKKWKLHNKENVLESSQIIYYKRKHSFSW